MQKSKQANNLVDTDSGKKIATWIILGILSISAITPLIFPERTSSNSKKREPERIFLAPLPKPNSDQNKPPSLSPYGATAAYLVKKLNSDISTGEEKVKLQDSTGSFDSLITLEKHEKSFAIVQADVLYHYLNGGHPQFSQGRKNSRIRAIGKLFPEFFYCRVIKSRAQDEQTESKGGKDKSQDKQETTRIPISLSTASEADAGSLGSGSLITSINVARYLQTRWLLRLHASSSASGEYIQTRVNSAPFDKQEEKNEFLWMTQSSAKMLENAMRGIYKSVSSFDLIECGESHKNLPRNNEATIALSAILVCTSDVGDSEIDELVEEIQFLQDERTLHTKHPFPSLPTDFDSSDKEHRKILQNFVTPFYLQENTSIKKLKENFYRQPQYKREPSSRPPHSSTTQSSDLQY